jgi:hypothetical protein
MAAAKGNVMTPREKYINAITDAKVRQQVYTEAHAKLSHNQCAYTQYLFLVHAGVLTAREPAPTMTSQLEHVLLTELKGVKRIRTSIELARGDVCFSRNMNNVPGPDHVYAFHSHTQGGALVVDNYARGPHWRNLGDGPKTPFDFALRLP